MSQPSGNAGSPGSTDDRTMAMLAHLLGIIIVIPLIIWILKKDSSSFIGDNAKEALNFQITMFIVGIAVGIVGCIPVLGLVTLIVGPLLGLVDIIFCVIGALAANKGELYRYPFAIRLVK